MPTSNPIQILLNHDQWATHQIILICESLTPAQFSQKFDLGPGSLQAALTHVISATNAWSDTLHQRPQSPRLDQSGQLFTPAQLLPLHLKSASEFSQIALSRPLDELVTRTREGKTFSFTRAVVITHVTTHAMHHRAQCLNMLKQLNVKPLPLSSVVEWSRAIDNPQ